MSSVGIAVNSKDFWKGSDCIERKLDAVLDRKVASSSKQVLLDRIEFKEASKPDPFYAQLKKKYTPLNSASVRQETNNNQRQNGKKNCEVNGLKVSKNELPAPKYVLFEKNRVHLHWKTVRSVGPGLFNLGNTCFLNSVIQVLTYTPPLVNYLVTQDHSRKCATVGFCMLCELQRHVLRTFSHNQNEAIKPLAILQKLKYIAKHLRFGQQEDSHEFLCYVIDGMMKSCLSGVPEKLDIYTKATTMVHQVFGGYYRSQVTCEKCHHTSNTYDPLMEVLLDIKHAHSVLNALHKLVSVEVLNGDNMYLCPRCKRKVPAKKSLRVHQAPNVMTMCLKRFDSHSLFGTKINKEISYPEQLNLRPFMSKNQGPAVHYRLYAVLVHSGYSCNSGHYYCFVKAANNHWYQMNDSSVRQVSLKTVLGQQAYLLFYIKDHNIQREKTGETQQPVRNNTWTNGTKTEGFKQKQHLPKVVNEPTKKPDKIHQFPEKPEPSWKQNVQTVKQFTPRPTTIPQQRDKITFALNHGTQVKKPNTSQAGEHGESETKAEIRSPEDNKPGRNTSAERGKEKLQVNEVSSSVEEDKKQDSSSAIEKSRESEPTGKDIEKETKNYEDIHATTKWTVTRSETTVVPTALLPGTLLLGALLPGARERTPSMSSELSNPGSVASKTGEWSVFDRSATQDVGPRLPERQHAGWKVSEVESPKKEDSTQDINRSEQTTEVADQVESHRKSKKKRKHSKEKSDRKKAKPDDETKLLSAESREHSEDDDVDERRRKKMERLRKLEKAKKRKSDQDSKGEDERREKKKKHKKSKKKKKQRKEKYEQQSDEGSGSKSERKSSDQSLNNTQEIEEDNISGIGLSSKSEQNSDSSFKKKLGNRKDRKNNKEETDSDKSKSEKSRPKSVNNSGSEGTSFSGEVIKNEERTAQSSEDNSSFKTKSNRRNKTSEYGSEENEFRTKTTKNEDVSVKTVVDRGREFVSKVSERRQKGKDDRKPLVEYSDDSSSSEEQASKGKSRVHEDTLKDNRGEKKPERRVKSRSSEEIFRENHERKNVVETLLVNSRKSSNYGRLVERWDGERDDDSSVMETEESNKRRRDFWDEEYDRGKVKRTKNRDKFHNHSYHGENSFQREYDRKRMRNDGWHSSSSNGWHRRSSDRWRDRR